jgi:hypothetical protein
MKEIDLDNMSPGPRPWVVALLALLGIVALVAALLGFSYFATARRLPGSVELQLLEPSVSFDVEAPFVWAAESPGHVPGAERIPLEYNSLYGAMSTYGQALVEVGFVPEAEVRWLEFQAAHPGRPAEATLVVGDQRAWAGLVRIPAEPVAVLRIAPPGDESARSQRYQELSELTLEQR